MFAQCLLDEHLEHEHYSLTYHSYLSCRIDQCDGEVEVSIGATSIDPQVP